MRGSNHVPQSMSNGEKRLMEKVSRHITAHLNADLKVSLVAKFFEISPATLQHLFKKQVNQSFQHFVEEKRITRAFELIMQGHRIKEIMQEIGYAYRSAFNKAFLKKFKHPPRYFRK